MKKMKVLVFLGMGSCVSEAVDHDSSSMVDVKETPPSVPLQLMGFGKTEIKDEVFFDSKPWLESDDDEFLSVNGASMYMYRTNSSSSSSLKSRTMRLKHSHKHKQTLLDARTPTKYLPTDHSPQHKHSQINNNGDDEQGKNNGAEDDEGRKLSDLLRKNNSFSSDSQTSVKAMKMREDEETTPKTPPGKTGKRFLPTLLRILSCGAHKKNKNKKRLISPTQISVAA